MSVTSFLAGLSFTQIGIAHACGRNPLLCAHIVTHYEHALVGTAVVTVDVDFGNLSQHTGRDGDHGRGHVVVQVGVACGQRDAVLVVAQAVKIEHQRARAVSNQASGSSASIMCGLGCLMVDRSTSARSSFPSGRSFAVAGNNVTAQIKATNTILNNVFVIDYNNKVEQKITFQTAKLLLV